MSYESAPLLDGIVSRASTSATSTSAHEGFMQISSGDAMISTRSGLPHARDETSTRRVAGPLLIVGENRLRRAQLDLSQAQRGQGIEPRP